MRLSPVLLSIALAGLTGEVLFEVYAWVISPALFGFALQPSNLVIAMTAKLTGISLSHSAAFVLHALIGSVGFGAVVYLTRRGLGLPVWATGLVAGVALWFIAQGLLAPFIGRSFMMDFGPYTQSSFIGHVGMTLIMAYALDALLTRMPRQTA
ncbi:hypothetical protein BV911_02130 [Pseudoruegeria sp. SK021]|nr:hypothetical protein BV911_02130 [Pseudoruegeria sp. SK021]